MGSCRRIANGFRIVGFNLAAVHMPRRSLFLFLIRLSFFSPSSLLPNPLHISPLFFFHPRCHRDSMIQRGDQLLESSQEIGSPNFRKLPVRMLLTFLHTFLPNDSWGGVCVSEISKSMSQVFVQIGGSLATFSLDHTLLFFIRFPPWCFAHPVPSSPFTHLC